MSFGRHIQSIEPPFNIHLVKFIIQHIRVDRDDGDFIGKSRVKKISKQNKLNQIEKNTKIHTHTNEIFVDQSANRVMNLEIQTDKI